MGLGKACKWRDGEIEAEGGVDDGRGADVAGYWGKPWLGH